VRVLVTGGAGFIGGRVVDLLLDRGDEVVVLDGLDPQVHPSEEWPEWSLLAAERGARLHRVTLPDAEAVGRILDDGIEAVVHLAARVGVGQSAYEIERYTTANGSGTASLLDEIVKRQATIRRVLVAGSMSCYGEGRVIGSGGDVPGWDRRPEDLGRGRWDLVDPFDGRRVHPMPTTEETPLRCSSVYAESKRVQEELTRIACGSYGISWAVTRFFNVYGPRQALSNPYTGVAAIFSSRLRAGRAPLVFEDGEQARDFVYVDDVARAVLALLDRPECVGVYNVGTGRRTTIREIALALGRVLGVPDLGVDVTGSYRVGDIRTCYADATKIAEATGWTAEVSLDDGLRSLAEWVSSQESEDRTDAAVEALRVRGLVR
jgi:dTDP-L-rhamnose 4-epimerase